MANEPPAADPIGFPEEWADFKRRHGLFFERFPNLGEAIEKAFPALPGAGPLDRVIFLLGRLCVEDFYEVLLLSGSGYGVAALKILRGMFERTVDALYLHIHPEEADAFLEFEWVAQHKLIRAILDTFGPEALPSKRVREVEEQFGRVKGRFEIADCPNCGTRRLNYTWSTLDLVSRAKEAGLGKLIVPDYYLPLRHAHSTAGAIGDRLESAGPGRIGFNPDAQPGHADAALIGAHGLLLRVLALQRERFELSALGGPLEICERDFREVWSRAD
ncbi:MAG: DUF5677 domain-containing protein [Terriglobales bacterium]